MSENSLELYLIKRVKEENGITFKLTSPSVRGLPDRIVIFDGGKIGFLELKATGKKPTSLQFKYLSLISEKSIFTAWANKKLDIEHFISQLKKL